MKHGASTREQLSNALRALGVNFIRGGEKVDVSLNSHPSRLITELAKSNEARLRLSLIPLFLEHPKFSSHVRALVKKLDPVPQLTLKCYYSVAIWLAKKYQLDISLPDYFSEDLNLTPVGDPDKNLRTLAKRHAELSGSYVNWLATYQHAEQVWRKRVFLKSESFLFVHGLHGKHGKERIF